MLLPLRGKKPKHVGQAASATADEVLLRNLAVVHEYRAVPGKPLAHLILSFPDGETRRIMRNDKCADTLIDVLFRVGDCEYKIKLRKTRIGDEMFGPVEDPSAVVQLGPGLERGVLSLNGDDVV